MNDVIHSQVSRCTFNGNGLASIAIAEDQPSGIIGSDTYADDVFENTGSTYNSTTGGNGLGFQCGWYAGCSEVVLLRSKFVNNSANGVLTMDANALNIWCWYCTFQNNNVGIGDRTVPNNINGAGKFDVFDSVFMNSAYADIFVGNIVEENFLGNYSIGSAAFMIANGLGGGAYPIILKGNTVLDTTGMNSDGITASVFNEDTNITILLDNTIRSLSTATAPVVQLSQGIDARDLLSVGNTLTLPVAGNCSGASLPVSINVAYSGSRCHEFGDQTVLPGTVNPSAPVLPGVPPNLGRTIYDASALTGAAIQTAINSAAVGCVNNVAHIPAGTYVVSSTITVPANCRVQIIGDGWYSLLTPSGTPNPIMKLAGPSQATLREFSVTSGGVADGIEIDDADQAGGLIYIDHIQVAGNTTGTAAGVFVDALDYTTVEIHDFLATSPLGQNALKVVGGTQADAGNWQGAATNVFAANTETGRPGYYASNGAHLLVFADWYESGSGDTPYAPTGQYTTFSHVGASLGNGSGAFGPSLTNFRGTSALIGENIAGTPTISLSGNGSGANDLILGDALSGAPTNTTSPADTMGFLNSYTYGTSTQLSESGASSQGFLTTTLNQLRSSNPRLPIAEPSGVTNIQIWHVTANNGVCGIHIETGSGVAC